MTRCILRKSDAFQRLSGLYLGLHEATTEKKSGKDYEWRCELMEKQVEELTLVCPKGKVEEYLSTARDIMGNLRGRVNLTSLLSKIETHITEISYNLVPVYPR